MTKVNQEILTIPGGQTLDGAARKRIESWAISHAGYMDDAQMLEMILKARAIGITRDDKIRLMKAYAAAQIKRNTALELLSQELEKQPFEIQTNVVFTKAEPSAEFGISEIYNKYIDKYKEKLLKKDLGWFVAKYAKLVDGVLLIKMKQEQGKALSKQDWLDLSAFDEVLGSIELRCEELGIDWDDLQRRTHELAEAKVQKQNYNKRITDLIDEIIAKGEEVELTVSMSITVSQELGEGLADKLKEFKGATGYTISEWNKYHLTVHNFREHRLRQLVKNIGK